MASDRTAKWSVNIPVETNADAAADSLEHLRARIEGGETAIKNMRAAFGRLRGSSDEVKAAKAQLTAKLNAERDAVSAANLKMLAAGTTYDSVAAKAKKLSAEQDALKKDKIAALSGAVSKAGGPVASLRDKMSALGDVVGGAGGAMAAAALGVAALVAAVVAVTAALVAGAVSLGKWVLGVANAERSMGLMREAAAGSGKNAYALGTQIDALAEKVPTARTALNDLAISLVKGGIQGQTLVDTLNAVGQASAAIGDDAGSKLRALVDSGRLTQRFQIGNPLESLQGTGLQSEDIAKSLAKNMRVSIGQARQALLDGSVKLGDGAKAMRDAVEAKFSGINLRRMRDLDVLTTKFKERLVALTKGVNIEPILEGFSRLSAMFDTSSQTGAALKSVITIFGNAMTKAFTFAMPFLETFLKGMIIGGLDLVIVLLKVHNYLKKAFGDSETLKNVDGLKLAMDAGRYAIYGVGAALAMTVAFVTAAAVPFIALAAIVTAAAYPFLKLQEYTLKTYEFFKTLDWAEVGESIVKGLITGLKAGAKFLDDAVNGLATDIKTGFKTALGIQSPSTVFAEYGRHTTAGYAEGVEEGTPAAAKALNQMGQAPSRAGGASGRGAGTSVEINLGGIHISAAGGDAQQIAKAMSDPSILGPLIKAIEDALLGGGMPVGT